MSDVKYLEVLAPTGRQTERDGKMVDEPWARVGVAFPFKDGSGFSIKLNSLPLNGELIVKPPREKEKKSTPAPEGI
jgi:hypothetical protein